MFEFPALAAAYWIIAGYAVVGLLPIYAAIFLPPQSRAGYILVGGFIMVFASFVLTVANEAIALATEYINQGHDLDEVKKSALVEFRKNVRFIGSLVTFLIGGVGVGVFVKVVPSLGREPIVSETILEEIRQLRRESKQVKTLLFVLFVLVVVGIVVGTMV